MQKHITNGIVVSCIGIALGVAIALAITDKLSYEDRGYIDIPLMLFCCIVFGVIGAIAGVKISKRESPDDPDSGEFNP